MKNCFYFILKKIFLIDYIHVHLIHQFCALLSIIGEHSLFDKIFGLSICSNFLLGHFLPFCILSLWYGHWFSFHLASIIYLLLISSYFLKKMIVFVLLTHRGYFYLIWFCIYADDFFLFLSNIQKYLDSIEVLGLLVGLIGVVVRVYILRFFAPLYY